LLLLVDHLVAHSESGEDVGLADAEPVHVAEQGARVVEGQLATASRLARFADLLAAPLSSIPILLSILV
jgi:hypothetical protein